MDEEIKKMLVHVLEGQEEIKIQVKNEISKVNDEISKVNDEISKVHNDISKLGATIDGELIPKQQALFDGYKLNTERLTEINDNISELRVDVNNLSIKALKSENKIIELDRKIAR